MINRNTSRAAAMAATLALGAAFGPTGAAAQAADVSQTEAEAFAVAAVQISEITQRYREQILSLDRGPERERLIEEAQDRVSSVFDETDAMDAERYNEIVSAAEGDPELAERLSQRIAEELQ